MTELWTYRREIDTDQLDLTDFDVEATDGHIGKVEEWSAADADSYLVVDTGFWIFGKKRVVPARAVKQINVAERKVFLGMTKDQVKDAPDHHPNWTEPERRDPFATYYDSLPW